MPTGTTLLRLTASDTCGAPTSGDRCAAPMSTAPLLAQQPVKISAVNVATKALHGRVTNAAMSNRFDGFLLDIAARCSTRRSGQGRSYQFAMGVAQGWSRTGLWVSGPINNCLLSHACKTTCTCATFTDHLLGAAESSKSCVSKPHSHVLVPVRAYAA
jgi:hypothetical protein